MKNQEIKYSAIEEYYRKHFDDLRSYVGNKVQYSEDADDIVQNVFLRLLSSDNILTQNTLDSLVYTIARNLIYDFYRHRQSVNEYMGYISLKQDNSVSTSSVYSIREIHELVEHGMARLCESQRKIYRMNIYDGLAVSEISKTLNMNYKSVENKLGTARKEVRRYVAKMLA